MDGRGLGKETCENIKEVASKYGFAIVCDDEDEQGQDADLVLPAGEPCENAKRVASKIGYTVVCDEEA